MLGVEGASALEGEGPTRWSKGTRPNFRVALIEAQRKAGTLARFGVVATLSPEILPAADSGATLKSHHRAPGAIWRKVQTWRGRPS